MASKEETNRILRDLYANISWYNENTSYNNSIRQALRTEASAILNTVATAGRTKFVPLYPFNYLVDTSIPLQYGPIPCSVPGKAAFLDSDFTCFIFQLPFFLEKIQFGYICAVVIIPIILISLFGKIKESYRWFLLNQALWDAFTCYNFICSRPTSLAWLSLYQTSTCFYSSSPANPVLGSLFSILRGSFLNAPYTPLLLLAFSRFLSMYFPNFYQRHAKTWKILTLIIGFNLTVMILTSAPFVCSQILTYLKTIQYNNCFTTFCAPEFLNYTKEASACLMKNEKYFQCFYQTEKFYSKFQLDYRITEFSITPVMFILNLIFVILLVIKVSWQLKYQMKHNRHAFLNTAKVVAVIVFQSISLFIYLIISGFQTFLSISAWGEFAPDTTITNSFSPGIMMLQNFATTTSINILRIFLDSFIVLVVLSGYRMRLLHCAAFFISLIKRIFRIRNVTITTPVITLAKKL